MISSVSVSEFKGVAHLESSSIALTHGGKIKFSTSKPNVLVGPNGSGKSALLTALSILTLTHFLSESMLSHSFLARNSESEPFWLNKSKWGSDFVFLDGLQAKTDHGPAFFYRPGHIPGNDSSIAASMMCGYFDEARQYARQTEHKSNGQQCSALLERIRQFLTTGEGAPELRVAGGMSFDSLPISPEDVRKKSNPMPWDYQKAVLLNTYRPDLDHPRKPLVIMDEPEQSLDTKTELSLWKEIASADLSKMQIIVATHSLYPMLNQDKFNIIEAVPGYTKESLALLS